MNRNRLKFAPHQYDRPMKLPGLIIPEGKLSLLIINDYYKIIPMPTDTLYKTTATSGIWRMAIVVIVGILSSFVLGHYYAMASAHTGFRKPLTVFIIIILALVFLFKWIRSYTRNANQQVLLVLAGLCCYICWVTSWDIHAYGGLHESSELEMLINPALLARKMNERFIYLSSTIGNSIFYRPMQLRLIYLGEFASFVWLAKYMSSRKA